MKIKKDHEKSKEQEAVEINEIELYQLLKKLDIDIDLSRHFHGVNRNPGYKDNSDHKLKYNHRYQMIE